jgi:hypothetical protein
MQVDGTDLVDIITPNGDAAATTFNPFNTDINTVRGQETGYATLNPLINGASTLSDGNLTATAPSGSTHGRARSTLTMDTSGTGKFYFEATLIVVGSTYPHIGVIDSVRNSDATYVGDATNCFSYFSTGNKQLEGASGASYGASFTAGDTLGCSLDCGSGELRFYKNGIDQGVATTITANYHACFAVSNYGSSGQWKVNFGQKPFKFPPPDGFQPLNDANVRPETVIARPDQYVGITTWTGDGNTGRNIKTFQFKPDLVWIKQRSATRAHALFDSVRGANKRLQSSSTNAETTHTDQMSAFIDNGFTVEDNNTVNVSSGTYVGWCWRAGGNKNTFNVDDVGYATAAAAGLNGGDLTVTGASVGTKQGFSIIKYTGSGNAGDSASHGLLEAPKFIITKNIDNGTYSWRVFTTVIDGSNDRLFLNATSSKANQSGAPVPTSSVFYVDSNLDHNKLNDNIIAYLWHDVPGLQKFGSYTGNGDTGDDGPFIELGFRPAIIWFKRTEDDGYNWNCYDTTRSNTGNPTNEVIRLNLTNTEEANYGNGDIDVLANGFKIRNYWGNVNAANKSYIYCAWAEAPSIDLFGGGANAR